MVRFDIVALRGILQSTHCFDAKQEVLIREEGKHADAELLLLAERIEAAKAVVDSLQQQIVIAEKFASLCALASSPSSVHQVPFELLAKIFTMATFGDFLPLQRQKAQENGVSTVIHRPFKAY
ncbi:hypothetical protein FA13DRAFT_1788042 [Coprinellus micaceus]|uniref:Uncharacterized protein n=1 Tax=Coprinellus micaceus TaxID=71717 RepID=A0A4Y7TMH3_COPMI|nr:hypothetical protein FA13DRAFT_1788042 [Coprinellus micaceus]